MLEEMTGLVNLLGYEVDIICNDNEIVTIPPSRYYATGTKQGRLLEKISIDGKTVDIWATNYYDVEVVDTETKAHFKLPEPRAGTKYIVSDDILEALQREDLLKPYLLSRDKAGNVGYRGFKVAGFPSWATYVRLQQE